MQLTQAECRLLILALPYGLDSDHLTLDERRKIRVLLARMTRYCDDAIGKGVDGSECDVGD